MNASSSALAVVATAATASESVAVMIASLPSELQWLVLSYSSLVDLPALHRVCSSFRCVLCELLHPPRIVIERSPSSSPRSSSVSLLSSPLPPLTAHFHHARPLLAFLSFDEPSLWRLLTVRAARQKAVERYVSPPPLIRRLLRRFPSLLPSFRRKHSRLAERLRLVDSVLQLAAVVPAVVAMSAGRSWLARGARWAALPVSTVTGAGGLVRCSGTAGLLLAYVAALTACDTQLAVQQRASAEASMQLASRHLEQEQQAETEAEAERWRDADGSDSDEDVEEAEDEEMEAVEQEDEQPGRAVRVDGDVAVQRLMLRSAEAALRARARHRRRVEPATVAAAADPNAPPSASTAAWRPTAAAAMAHARSMLKREDGSSLLVRLLAATLSAARSELVYRHVLIAAVYASLAAVSSLFRRFALLNAIRLLADGLIPLIPLLAIAHSLLSEMEATPALLTRLVEQLHHPRVIVAVRLIGLLTTLAANGALYQPSMLRLFDRLLLPAMDLLTLRCLRLPYRSAQASLGSVQWLSPFAIDSPPPSLPLPLPHCLQPSHLRSTAGTASSSLRLLALSLFVSQLLCTDDSRCLEASSRVRPSAAAAATAAADVPFSASAAVHRWLLSVALLHCRLSGGVCASIVVHALLNCAAVLTRRLTM